MLWKRIATAAVLIPPLVASILFSAGRPGGWPFLLLCAAAAALCADEGIRMFLHTARDRAAGIALASLRVNPYLYFAGYVILQYVVIATAWNILGGYAGVPHGITSCISLAATLEWNEPVNARRQRAVAAIVPPVARMSSMRPLTFVTPQYPAALTPSRSTSSNASTVAAAR